MVAMRMPKVIISDKASYTLMLSPPRWRKPTHQYLLNYYNIIKQKIPQPSQAGGSGDFLPIGTILPYTGSLLSIPAGWHLCDGTDGTPDLRGRFLEGSDVAGVFLEPALPNIKDWSNNRVMLLMYNNPSAKGVITFRRGGSSGGAVTDSDPEYGNDYIKNTLSFWSILSLPLFHHCLNNQ